MIYSRRASTVDVRGIVQRLWNYCQVLRDDGVSYGDYVGQLSFLLFLKMEDEAVRAGTRRSSLPDGARWNDLLNIDGLELEARYIEVLQTLARQDGVVGRIFVRAQNHIQDAGKLRRLIALIDAEHWSEMDTDIKGAIYEGILERNAEDVKSGAGQYFTPRPLVRAIVAVTEPSEGELVCDPACGTGGFLLEARKFIKNSKAQARHHQRKRKTSVYAGWEIVPETARLCLMNLHLRGVPDEEIDVCVGDALLSMPHRLADLVLTNPPFGRRSSMTFTNEERSDADRLIYRREDFIATTSDKQLNFLQHVMTLVGKHGRAAVILPDGTLSDSGAGETIRRALLEQFDVHTLLRLPTGIFYAGAVKSSVLFFDKKNSREQRCEADALWTYDLRTGHRFSMRAGPLHDEVLVDFIKLYGGRARTSRRESERFTRVEIAKVLGSDRCSLDVGMMPGDDREEEFETPAAIAREIVERLEAAADAIRAIEQQLER